jgi:Tfp pilus assembly protein PilV
MLVHTRSRGVSLLEILVAFVILLIAVLTMVGYTTTIHRAARESKREAVATMEARSLLERIRDYPPMFLDAASPAGYTETKTEYLLDTEAIAEDNELGQQSAAQFQVEGRAQHISGEIYGIVVTVRWDEDGRQRKVVLESRLMRQDR